MTTHVGWQDSNDSKMLCFFCFFLNISADVHSFSIYTFDILVGEVDEENSGSVDKDWYQYWRLLFAKISVKDIEEFEKKYKGV